MKKIINRKVYSKNSGNAKQYNRSSGRHRNMPNEVQKMQSKINENSAMNMPRRVLIENRMACWGQQFMPAELRQESVPNASNRWYTVINQQNNNGHFMYTALMTPEPRDQCAVSAKPAVTYFAMGLPNGAAPNIRCTTPGMNYTTGMGPLTNIQVNSHNISNGDWRTLANYEVLPLSCVQVAPLQRSLQNLAFLTYSMIQLTLNENLSQRPDKMVYNLGVSPIYPISDFQQHRLRAAILAHNVPLADALQPIIEDMYEEHEKRQLKDKCVRQNKLCEKFFKTTHLKLKPSDMVMALDGNGKYNPMSCSEWIQRKMTGKKN